MSIRPGLNIRVVTEVDLMKETIHVTNAVVYDIDGPTLTISQTDPPILASKIGKEIEITYLTREKGEQVRYGFPVRVKAFIDNYRLNSSREAKAVVVERKGEDSPYNLRMFYRVTPTSRSGLAIAICGQPVNVLDISLGGARISYSKTFPLQSNSWAEGALRIDSMVHAVNIRIVRTWDGSGDGFSNDLEFGAIEFVGVVSKLERELSRKIREIEVESLPQA